MGENEPYIILNDNFFSWRWFRNVKVTIVYLWLLLCANEKDGYYEKDFIPRGSIVTNNSIIAERCGMTIQNVRTVLANLEETGEITRERRNHYQIITLTDYESFKDDV